MSDVVIAGRYELREPLGAGGSGSVFVARDRRLEERVAVKLAPARTDLHTLAARFRREARIGSRLGKAGSGFVRALDQGEVAPDCEAFQRGWRLFLVMDLIEGARPLELLHGTLEERLRRVLAAARLVEAFHARGVIHRDLKPANLLQGEDGAIHLADFGLARLLDAEDETAGEKDLTATQSALGTPRFMPLEQFDDARSVDARADVFSLGVMLFLALTGEHPYPAENASQVLLRLVEVQAGRRPAPRPGEHVASLPAGLDALCAHAIQRAERRDETRARLCEPIEPAGIVAWSERVSSRRGASAAIAVERESRLGSARELVVGLEEGLRALGGADEACRRARERQRRHDTGGALACWSEALVLEPARLEARLGRAHSRLKQGDLDGAVADCSAALLITRDSAEAWFLLAQARARQGDHDQAIACWDDVLRLQPRDADAFLGRAQALRAVGDLEAALADCERAIELEPHFAPAWTERGQMRATRGEHARALEDFEAAIRLGPEEPIPHRNRARALRALGRADDAAAAEREAERLTRFERGEGPRRPLP